MIQCSACGSQQSSVVDSRPRDDACTRRRRKCDDCGHRWSTVEVSLEDYQASLDSESLEAMRTAYRALKAAFHRLNTVTEVADEERARERKPYKLRSGGPT